MRAHRTARSAQMRSAPSHQRRPLGGVAPSVGSAAPARRQVPRLQQTRSPRGVPVACFIYARMRSAPPSLAKPKARRSQPAAPTSSYRRDHVSGPCRVWRRGLSTSRCGARVPFGVPLVGPGRAHSITAPALRLANAHAPQQPAVPGQPRITYIDQHGELPVRPHHGDAAPGFVLNRHACLFGHGSVSCVVYTRRLLIQAPPRRSSVRSHSARAPRSLRHQHDAPRRQRVFGRMIEDRYACRRATTGFAAHARYCAEQRQTLSVRCRHPLQRERARLLATLVATQAEQTSVKLQQWRIEHLGAGQGRGTELGSLSRGHDWVVAAVGRTGSL